MDFAEDELTLSKLMEKNNESDKSKSHKKNQKGDKWEDEKRIFETQLNQLQEQLVATMVQNQQLGKGRSNNVQMERSSLPYVFL